MLRDVDPHGFPERDPDREKRMERLAVASSILCIVFAAIGGMVLYALWAGL